MAGPRAHSCLPRHTDPCSRGAGALRPQISREPGQGERPEAGTKQPSTGSPDFPWGNEEAFVGQGEQGPPRRALAGSMHPPDSNLSGEGPCERWAQAATTLTQHNLQVLPSKHSREQSPRGTSAQDSPEPINLSPLG